MSVLARRATLSNKRQEKAWKQFLSFSSKACKVRGREERVRGGEGSIDYTIDYFDIIPSNFENFLAHPPRHRSLHCQHTATISLTQEKPHSNNLAHTHHAPNFANLHHRKITRQNEHARQHEWNQD
jgi:hypothetical protein